MTKEQILQIIEEELEAVILERCQKGYKTHPTRKTKKMYGKTYRNCVKADEGVKAKADRYDPRKYVGRDAGRRFSASSGGKLPPKGLYGEYVEVDEAKDPKTGTGKKPKGSGRRLYTDENPKDTVRIKFATPSDARATVRKVKNINKPFARKIQILTVMEQRAKVMGKRQVVNIANQAKKQIRKTRKV